MGYWTLCSNPNNYRIEEAVKNLELDWWAKGNHDIQNGDRVLIWRALGHGEHRGIVALGEVVGDAEIRSDADNPYNIGEFGQEEKERVPVCYVLPPNVPLWVGGEYDHLLTPLSVYHARGGAFFHVEDGQWRAIVEASGGWTHQDQERIEGFRRDISLRQHPETRPGPYGEGKDHKELKEWIAEHPGEINLYNVRSYELEHPFISGDAVDILFERNDDTDVVVEVEIGDPLPGCYQAIKYRALRCAERGIELGSQNVTAVVVTPRRIPDETKAFCDWYDIRYFDKRLRHRL